ncbi:hypothetical protein RHECNPAF_1330086 [Rhizobium etli CNPAF512]|nr:hypothetical protein RHECNPAF_1330086 [Rhizobium etli CNPAF512]
MSCGARRSVLSAAFTIAAFKKASSMSSARSVRFSSIPHVPRTQISARIPRTASTASAPVALRVRRLSLPPTKVTSAIGWSSAAAAMSIDVVRIRTCNDGGRLRKKWRTVVLESTKIVTSLGMLAAAARPIADLSGASKASRRLKSRTGAERRIAPPWNRCTSRASTSSFRSRRIESSETQSSRAIAVASTRPSLLILSSKMAWRSSGEDVGTTSCLFFMGTTRFAKVDRARRVASQDPQPLRSGRYGNPACWRLQCLLHCHQ